MQVFGDSDSLPRISVAVGYYNYSSSLYYIEPIINRATAGNSDVRVKPNAVMEILAMLTAFGEETHSAKGKLYKDYITEPLII